jgi:hypothetical protein
MWPSAARARPGSRDGHSCARPRSATATLSTHSSERAETSAPTIIVFAPALHDFPNSNRESGRPFYREVCTAFIERIFGGRDLFDDVEVLDWLVPGPGPRIPEPAAPCFKSNARLSRRARSLLRVDELPAVHAAVEAAQAPDPARPTATGDEALQRLSDQKRGPARVLFWFLAQLGRAWAVRRPR